jgi:hypothetical protein
MCDVGGGRVTGVLCATHSKEFLFINKPTLETLRINTRTYSERLFHSHRSRSIYKVLAKFH